MSYKVSVVIEKDDSGYFAYSPELQGCVSQGDTFEEAMLNIKEAVELYLEDLNEEEKNLMLSRQIVTTNLEINVI